MCQCRAVHRTATTRNKGFSDLISSCSSRSMSDITPGNGNEQRRLKRAQSINALNLMNCITDFQVNSISLAGETYKLIFDLCFRVFRAFRG